MIYTCWSAGYTARNHPSGKTLFQAIRYSLYRQGHPLLSYLHPQQQILHLHSGNKYYVECCMQEHSADLEKTDVLSFTKVARPS